MKPAPKRKVAWWKWALGGVLALAALGAVLPEPPAEPTNAATPVPTPDSACTAASPELVAAILQGAPGATLTNVQVTRSGEHEQAYYVAGQFTNPRLLDDQAHTAIWATNELDGTGSIFSVSGFALQGSQWGDGTRTQAEFSSAAPDAAQAARCSEAL